MKQTILVLYWKWYLQMFCILWKHFFIEVCICVLVFVLANMYAIVFPYMSAKIFEKSSFSSLLFLLLKSKTQILKHFLQFQNISLILISSWTTKMVCEYLGTSFMVRLLWDMSVFRSLYHTYQCFCTYGGGGGGGGSLHVFKNLYSQLIF